MNMCDSVLWYVTPALITHWLPKSTLPVKCQLVQVSVFQKYIELSYFSCPNLSETQSTFLEATVFSGCWKRVTFQITII